MKTAIMVSVLGLTLIACAGPEGEAAIGTPEWDTALKVAESEHMVSSDCRDVGTKFKLLTDNEWKEQGLPSNIGGRTSEDGTQVYVRAEGFHGTYDDGTAWDYSVSFLLVHEFVHAILQCEGHDVVSSFHVGHIWDGLRTGDSEERFWKKMGE